MAKPNYSFKKKQREDKKAKQQQEKLARKLARSESAKPATTPTEEQPS